MKPDIVHTAHRVLSLACLLVSLAAAAGVVLGYRWQAPIALVAYVLYRVTRKIER